MSRFFEFWILTHDFPFLVALWTVFARTNRIHASHWLCIVFRASGGIISLESSDHCVCVEVPELSEEQRSSLIKSAHLRQLLHGNESLRHFMLDWVVGLSTDEDRRALYEKAIQSNSAFVAFVGHVMQIMQPCDGPIASTHEHHHHHHHASQKQKQVVLEAKVQQEDEDDDEEEEEGCIGDDDDGK
jgi:hypothetical protein